MSLAFDEETRAHLESLKKTISAQAAVDPGDVDALSLEIVADLDELLELYEGGPRVADLQDFYGCAEAKVRAALEHLKTKGIVSFRFVNGVGRIARGAAPDIAPPIAPAVTPPPPPPAGDDDDDDERAPAPTIHRATPARQGQDYVAIPDRILAMLKERFGAASQFEAPATDAIARDLQCTTSAVYTAFHTLMNDGSLIRVKAGSRGGRAIYRWPESSQMPVVAAPAVAEAPAPTEAPERAPPRTWNCGGQQPSKRHNLSRFGSIAPEPDRIIDLRANHPALVQDRTIFPSTVVSPWQSPRLLVSGHNNRKLGATVEKGPWAGMPLYHLTLEERATCPRSCLQWASCYGNAMHLARRHDHRDPHFLPLLEAELWLLARENPQGFVVRLHTLGDFFSVEYVRFWAHALDEIPGLRVFGYTACLPWAEDETEAAIGAAIDKLTRAAWDHFAIRFSGHAGAQGSHVLVKPSEDPGTLMCPAQSDKTLACATCGLCWSDAARDKAIGFLKHGMKGAGPGEDLDG